MYLENLEKENLELKKQVEELKIDNGKLKERIRKLESDKSTVASVPVRTEEKKELSNFEKLKVGVMFSIFLVIIRRWIMGYYF